MAELKPQWKEFAEAYIRLGSVEKAAIEAKYSPNYARKRAYLLLENVGIKEYIAKRMKSIDAEKIAASDEVLQYLTEVMRGNKKDQFGLDAPLSERTRAAELLGKRHGIFKEKIEVSENVSLALILKSARKRAVEGGKDG